MTLLTPKKIRGTLLSLSTLARFLFTALFVVI